MSLNKFMHPRNKYKKPPDFKNLAIKYPEFRKYAIQDISGKVCLDFKNLESVRALTTTLLKEDFSLDVEIPINRLVPTLPLRLNYLLWIEDILKINKTSKVIKGIDIGCGASCVYPLLAAKHFCWHMLATEMDTESAFIASNNVRRNNLQAMITVKTVNEGEMLHSVVDNDIIYDFCMCNPPFFSSEDELDPQNVARSPSRPAPRNARSGALGELVAPGGETAFVTKIIEDSIKLKEIVRIYTVMVGHKTSVNKVKHALQEAGITQAATTEFCQGRTTRWGVCWTLDSTVVLPQVKDVPLTLKKKAPFSYTFDLDINNTLEQLYQLMNQLQITHTSIKNNAELKAMEITAMSNTWSNSRKKRRQEKFKQTDSINKNCDNANEKSKECESESNQYGVENGKNENHHEKDYNVKSECTIDVNPQINEKSDAAFETGRKRHLSEEDSELKDSSKRMRIDNEKQDSGSNEEPFLFASMMVKRTGQDKTLVELCWVRGRGGRDAAHQVLQYFKNNIKVKT